MNILWEDIGNKPTEFPPESHTHPISDIDGLQDELDDLAMADHVHNIDDINGLQDELDLKASVIAITGGTY